MGQISYDLIITSISMLLCLENHFQQSVINATSKIYEFIIDSTVTLLLLFSLFCLIKSSDPTLL